MPTATPMKLHKTRIDIPENQRIRLVETLNAALALLTDLRSQAKQAHWNVKGIHFIALHELFDELATELTEQVDMVAERATTLGGVALGTVRLAASGTVLKEMPLELADGHDFVDALADRYAQAGKLLRQWIDTAEEQGDKDTADLFTEISRQTDLRLWFLEAHLQA